MGVGAGWYYDSADGDVTHQNLVESLANVGFSYFHGPYKTEALAIAHKGVAGPPGTPNESLGSQAETVATGSSSPIAGLFQGNLWLRVGEVVLGLLLIAIGVAELTHAVPAATAIAGAVK